MESFESCTIVRTSFALVIGRVGAADIRTFGPCQSEPAKVVVHSLNEIQPEANGIQIVVAQDKHSSGGACAFRGDPKGAGVTKMKVTGRRRREAPAIQRRRRQVDG
jgi:hypothetical protein